MEGVSPASPNRAGIEPGGLDVRPVALHCVEQFALQASVEPGSFEFVEFFEQLIKGLPEQIALVDEHWTILAINSAWCKTAALYGYEALRPGTNYLEFCRDRSNEGHRAAMPAVEGIKEIDAGARDTFSYHYDGNDRWEGYTFQLRINRLTVGGRTFATVIRNDVTELVQLRRLRENFSQSVIVGQSDERRRIGREIHDSTLQLLTSLGLALGHLKQLRKPRRTLDIIADMEHLLYETQREIRSISYLAHPPLLADMGLRDALAALSEGFGGRTGLSVSFQTDGDVCIAWRAAELALYRIVQEALSNAYRHAHARTVDVGLFGRATMIHAIVMDDGVGMPAIARAGVGLPGMRDRLAELGGRLSLRHRKSGVAIIASVPRVSRTEDAIGDLGALS